MRVVDDIELFMSSPHPGRVLDAFPEAAVVVRRWGDIIAHNQAWRRFSASHAKFSNNGGIGYSYADVISVVARLGAQEAQSLTEEVNAVLGGLRYSGTFTTAGYPGGPEMEIKIHLPCASSEVGVITHRFSPQERSSAGLQGITRPQDNKPVPGMISRPEPVGFSLLDGQLRLLQWNSDFPEICGVPAEIVEAGLPMREILRAQAQAGEFGPLPSSQALDSEVARRTILLQAGKSVGLFERERPNGRVLELRRAESPGGGYVTLYSDVTERKRTNLDRSRGMRPSAIRSCATPSPNCG